MTYVYNKYKVKIENGTGGMTAAKNESFIGLKNFWWWGDKDLVG